MTYTPKRNRETVRVATEPGYQDNPTKESLHFFEQGSTVKVLRDNEIPARNGRETLPAHRWLCEGRSYKTGERIVQWLAAEDMEEIE